VRYGATDTAAGTGHHNDFVFNDPIRICHSFFPLAFDGASDHESNGPRALQAVGFDIRFYY
jgi:hypothetical protein